MKIMAVLAVLLAAALFVGAASAAADQNKGPIFVYQNISSTVLEDLNGTGTQNITLYKMSEGSTPAIIDTITLNANDILWAELVGQNTGTWYINEANVSANYTAIWYPEVTLKAELAQWATGDVWTTKGDSIDGKTINRDTNVSFIVESPKLAGQNVNGTTNATVKLVFTTPVGGKTSTFGGVSFQTTELNKTREVSSGVHALASDAAGTWTVQAEFAAPAEFKNYASKSNTISFTLQSTSLIVTVDKDSVVRSNPFTITIQGNSLEKYNVIIKNPEDEAAKNPALQPGQNGWKGDITNGAIFETDASGKRTIQYNTNASTEDKTYTFRVEKVSDSSDWDEVKVKVEKGAVTISASGDGSYYIGTEITLSGTNTDSEYVYLFITGPNLAVNGYDLLGLTDKVKAGDKANVSVVSVKTDNTWEKKWNTAQTGLDTGAYTIYATSDCVDKSALSDTEYATVSVNLKQPFLSAVPSGTVVAKGDDLYVRGTAEGEPNDLKIYIFGPNKFVPYSVSVEDDGTYEKKITIGSDWSSNQYFVVIQHPMYNGEFDAILNETASEDYFYIKDAKGGEQASFYVEGTNKLQGSNAADALTKMIDSANIDDIYTKLTFTVAEPRIDIVNPGDQGVGTKFTISGTTNLAVDDQILVEVVSSSFNAVDKTSTSTTSGVSQTTKVVAGEGADNTWSVDVDTTNWKLDEYTIKVSGIEVDVSTTTNFNVVEKVVTTVPTTSATTAVPTGATTAPATTAPTQTPGFGAFIALAGLGAVALLVLRRN